MVLYIVTKIIAVVVLLICLGFIAYWLVARAQGDCHFTLLGKKKTPFQVERLGVSSAVLTCTVPIQNDGRQNGTLMDVFCRTYLPREQYDGVSIHGTVCRSDAKRDDDYWEAYIVNKGDVVNLHVTLHVTSKSGNLLRDLEQFPGMAMDIIYQVVGRSDWYYDKTRIYLTEEELRNALYRHTSEVKA